MISFAACFQLTARRYLFSFQRNVVPKNRRKRRSAYNTLKDGEMCEQRTGEQDEKLFSKLRTFQQGTFDKLEMHILLAVLESTHDLLLIILFFLTIYCKIVKVA